MKLRSRLLLFKSQTGSRAFILPDVTPNNSLGKKNESFHNLAVLRRDFTGICRYFSTNSSEIIHFYAFRPTFTSRIIDGELRKAKQTRRSQQITVNSRKINSLERENSFSLLFFSRWETGNVQMQPRKPA
jgi:hypothetical protein